MQKNSIIINTKWTLKDKYIERKKKRKEVYENYLCGLSRSTGNNLNNTLYPNTIMAFK